MNRDVTTAAVDLSFRPSLKAYVSGGYEWKTVDREYYMVSDTETKTVSNRLFANLNLRPSRKFRARITAEHAFIDDPFASPNAICESDIDSQDYRQYYLRDQFLTGDVAARPDSATQLRAVGTWTVNPQAMLSASLRWVDQSNDELTYGDWERTLVQPGLTFNWAPSPKFGITAGYLYIMEETEAVYSVTVMDG